MYVDIIFIQDSETVEELGNLTPRDALLNFDGHITLSGPTAESIQLVAEYLAQWDFGTETDDAHTEDGNPSAYADYEFPVTVDGTEYTIYADVLGSVWLTRAPLGVNA